MTGDSVTVVSGADALPVSPWTGGDLVRDGEVRESHHSIRIPTIPELRGWLAGAGFTSSTFTARDGSAPSLDRRRLVVVATA